MATLDDLLNALSSVKDKFLANTKETWRRIGNRDSFLELEMEGSELDDFLNEWTDNNPYSNI